MTSELPPNLLRLFAPRPPLEYLAPVDTDPSKKRRPRFTCISDFVDTVHDQDYQPTKTAQQKREEYLQARKEKVLNLKASIQKEWDPTKYETATENAYNTLFVSNLSYDTTADQVKKSMESYGAVKTVVIVKDRNGKSKGYAFVEFESDAGLKVAVRESNGLKVNGRRLLVDVERGRTQKDWKPKKCGGGLGTKRVYVHIVKEKVEKKNDRDRGDRGTQGGFRNSRPMDSRRDDRNFQGKPGDRNGGGRPSFDGRGRGGRSFGDRGGRPFEGKPDDRRGGGGRPFEGKPDDRRGGRPFEGRTIDNRGGSRFEGRPTEDRRGGFGSKPPMDNNRGGRFENRPFEDRGGRSAAFEKRDRPPFEKRDDRRPDFDRRDDRRDERRRDERDERDRPKDDRRDWKKDDDRHRDRDQRDSRGGRDSRDRRDDRDSRRRDRYLVLISRY
jgi:U1 small nuclear ribonucleoprotein 70kDa